ncbi:MAG: hypothetical protein GY758_09065 [Fuerstiella sp.]|nr:hypothetical protein [Fuerstiella sp.]MCP4506670.1 hypothetical protein [Fuerstiella sp.]
MPISATSKEIPLSFTSPAAAPDGWLRLRRSVVAFAFSESERFSVIDLLDDEVLVSHPMRQSLNNNV